MEKQAVVVDLEQLAMLMAQALPDLECPECCGPIHGFIESGSKVYQEEWEWACLFYAIRCARQARKNRCDGT